MGANDGCDTAYYHGLGYKVVAIEADPALAGHLNTRFAEERRAGQIMVLNVAVTKEDRGMVDFYVSKDNSKSSLIPEMAGRDHAAVHPVRVAGRSLCSLFDEFGVPGYCKLDIEGYDASAISGLIGYKDPPPYISCESTDKSIGEINLNDNLLYETLEVLLSAGYSSFKLIDQDSLLVLSEKEYYRSLQKWSTRLWTKMERYTGRFTPRYNNKLYLLKKGQLKGEEASGPFGEALDGEWMDTRTTKRRLAAHFRDYFNCTQNKKLVFWVDIHAKY